MAAGGAAGAGAASGELRVRSKDVNPDSCAGRGGADGGGAADAGAGESLPNVRSSAVNPPLPAPLEAGAGGGSATDALSADASLMRSRSSGELSAPAPSTTLWTTGSANGLGGGCGFGGSCASNSRNQGSGGEAAAGSVVST